MTHILIPTPHELHFAGKTYRCATGKGGMTQKGGEGDGATPLGTFPLREGWYRADRVILPATSLPFRQIQPDDGWCDDPAHPLYNLPVKLPFAASHEKMWREEHVYDIVIPLGYNDDPIVPGKGSAIFFHLARPDYSPTEGCIALALADMLEVLAGVTRGTRMVIG